MTTTELRELMVEMLAGAVGGEPPRWRKCVGDVTWHPLSMGSKSNWTINPTGDVGENRTIEKAETILRSEHPYVDRG